MGITCGDTWESNLHPSQFRLEWKDGHARGGLYGFLMAWARWQGTGSYSPEAFVDGRQEGRRVKIAHGDKNHIVRGIPCIKNLEHVLP